MHYVCNMHSTNSSGARSGLPHLRENINGCPFDVACVVTVVVVCGVCVCVCVRVRVRVRVRGVCGVCGVWSVCVWSVCVCT